MKLVRASGAVHVEIPHGPYRVTVAKDGYGSKRMEIDLQHDEPYQFRLLKDTWLGYAWPKWVRGGEKSEFRVHSDEAFKLWLWRYGWRKELIEKIGWFDEHGPRATV